MCASPRVTISAPSGSSPTPPDSATVSDLTLDELPDHPPENVVLRGEDLALHRLPYPDVPETSGGCRPGAGVRHRWPLVLGILAEHAVGDQALAEHGEVKRLPGHPLSSVSTPTVISLAVTPWSDALVGLPGWHTSVRLPKLANDDWAVWPLLSVSMNASGQVGDDEQGERACEPADELAGTSGLVMVGGAAADVEFCQPAFSTYGVRWCTSARSAPDSSPSC